MARPPADDESQTRRVLVVEDHKATALLERKALERSGYTVTVVSTGAAALAHIETEDPHAVVLDHRLPDMDGMEVLEAMGERIHELPVIMVTGTGDEDLAVAALKFGVVDYLVKDAKLTFLGGLPRVVQSVIERARLTARNRILQDKLRSREEQFRYLVENLDGLPWTYDTEAACFTYVGPQAEAFVGFPPSEWTTECCWSQHIHPEDRLATEGIHNTAIERSENHTMEYRMLCADGSVIWVRNLVTVNKLTGKRQIITGVLIDITSRKKAEEHKLVLEREVQSAQKLESLSVLAGGIAHDFNNLLMAILANVQLSLFKLPAQSPARSHLEQVQQATARAAELTKQMLMFSGRGRVSAAPLGLAMFARSLMPLLKDRLPDGVSMKSEFAPDTPFIRGDAEHMQEVIRGLFSNACDAIATSGGIIHLSTGRVIADTTYADSVGQGFNITPGAYGFLEVTDNGVGMDSELISKIFEPFFTTKFHGRGLGLAGLQGIVRSHGGALTVNSKPGQGTTFRALFPAAQAQGLDVLPAEKQVDTEWRGSGTVLVIDDEILVREVTEQLLSRWGFDVLTAVDGQDGVDVFLAHPDTIELVLLGMTMPRRDGPSALAEIRKLRPKIQVILSSGYREQNLADLVEGDPAAQFVQKPYSANTLQLAVRAALANSPASNG